MNDVSDRPASIRLLRFISHFIPGNFLKTFVYLNCIHRPRKTLRNLLLNFYRMELIYDVLAEFKHTYKGRFSVLEFGVADGYTFTKMLYASRYLKFQDRVTVHGFDTFEGMPKTNHEADGDLIANDGWVEGQFKTNLQSIVDYCDAKYPNYRIHKGFFEDTLTDEVISKLKEEPPIFLWIDCDYYSSSRTVMERLIPVIPNGCVVYFDEPEFNYGSRFTGESRLIHEINHGHFGDGIELVLDPALSITSKRVYRFINIHSDQQYDRFEKQNRSDELHRRTNDSPFP